MEGPPNVSGPGKAFSFFLLDEPEGKEI